jgi:hypothetical protein
VTEREIPLVILGGSDRRAGRLPPAGADKHPLAGYKGAELRFAGRPLVSLVLERARASGAFGPAWVAGPARVYGGMIGDAALVDTDSTFAGNIRAAIAAVRAARPASPIAFLTCDVLPPPAVLARLMGSYAETAPSDFWFPMVVVPETPAGLGASAWKPAYPLTPAGAGRPVRVLPGHLVVIDPEALRLAFMYRLFDVGYGTRNRPIAARRRAMLRALVGGLLLADLGRLARLRPPDVTVTVLGAGLRAAARLRRGALTIPELERALRLMFVRREHRLAHPERRVVIPLVDELSLATDIDTVEEARALGGDVAGSSALSA